MDWHWDGTKIIFMSDAHNGFGQMELFQVSISGGVPIPLNLGPAEHVSFGPVQGGMQGPVLIGRHTTDLSRWKRYRGGKVGKLFIDLTGTGNFSELIKTPGNVASPMWIGDR